MCRYLATVKILGNKIKELKANNNKDNLNENNN